MLFAVDNSTQNLLKLTIFNFTEIPTLSISNCLSECLPKYSAFLFSQNPKADSPGPVLKRKPLVGYNLHSQACFLLPHVKSVNYGLKTLRDFGSKIWNFLPIEKSRKNTSRIHENVRSWIPRNCPCRTCGNYIYQVGFTNIHENWEKCQKIKCKYLVSIA